MKREQCRSGTRPEVLTGMLEEHTFAITCIALVLIVLALIRPSSGMRMIVLGMLLAAAALVQMGLGFRNLLSGST